MHTRINRKWKRCIIMASMAMAVAAVTTSCIDDNYDLSDIDTSVRVQAHNLSLPVNLDKIVLSDIINIYDDSRVQIVDGEYTVIEDGSIDTETIKINPINIKAPETTPSTTVVEGSAEMRAADHLNFHIFTAPVNYSFKSYDVSRYINAIDRCYGDMTLDISLVVNELEGKVSQLTLTDVVIQLPKGLCLKNTAGGKYDPATGVYTVPSMTSRGNRFNLHLDSEAFDLVQMGDVFNPAEHSIIVDGKMNISANLVVTLDQISGGSIPQKLTMVSDFRFSDLNVTAFDGEFYYDIADFNIPDVDLSNLPGILDQEGTAIRLSNPVIYLQLDNPLQQYDVFARTGLEITATFRNGKQGVYTLDNKWFNVGPGIPSGVYNYALSPRMPEKVDPAFSPAEHVAFSALSDVLYGDGTGLPSRLSVALVDPEVPAQKVKNFPVGREVGKIKGKYRFSAPLDLDEGSTVQYTDVIDGWWSEDLNDLTITHLTATLEITTDIPLGVKFTGYPIDREGNRINNVEIKGATVAANANHQRIVLELTGAIKGLDGLRFTAVADANSGKALQPGMNIELSKILVTASAYFDHEL